MEEDTKGRRWRVTYTKHLKQKRKVYHDGFLELTASGDKVRLYDESENLIESKFLKKDDSVESGNSLTMDGHLVDIADPMHLSSNPTVTPPLEQQNDDKNVKSKWTGIKRNTFNRKSLHKVSNLMNCGIQASAKKAEPCTTGVPSSNSTLPYSLLEEWSVLYTTQLTQKAKKYLDGTLRLSQLGSHAKQVRLYDESERLLESKILGKEDVLESGQTLIMQAHLVDIGLSIIQVGKKNISVSSLIKPFQKPAPTSCSFVETKKEAAPVEATPGTNSVLKEWNVLYTTQLNKKFKTYHDGSLRLAQATGSLTKQITLASVDGQILGCRHLKSSECIESGAECELPGYLVQVYDLRICQKGNNQRSPLKQFVKSKILMRSIPVTSNDETKKEQTRSMASKTGNSSKMGKSTNNKKCVGVAQQDGCAGDNQRSPLEQFVKSKALMKIPTTTNGVDDEANKEQVKSMNPQTGNRMEMEKSTNNKKCVSAAARRDACQIMSVLKKPTAVLETEVAQVVKKANSSSQLIQIEDNPGEEELPSSEGIHDSYGNAYQKSLTSPLRMESGAQASKENCSSSSSSMHNSSSVLSDTTMSALYEGRCEAVILDLKKADGRGYVEPSFADTDNLDFPSFDLGF